MQPANLIKGRRYHYRITADSAPIEVTYRYETLNCYLFDSDTFTTYYLHNQQVISQISEIK